MKSRLFSILIVVIMSATVFAPAASGAEKTVTTASSAINWTEIRTKIWDLIYTDVKKVDLSDYKIKAGTPDYEQLHYCVYYTPQHLWPRLWDFCF